MDGGYTNNLELIKSTILDVLPIIVLIVVFQVFVIKKTIPHLKKVVVGFIMVVLGLAFFLIGLEMALFPLGKTMANQLADPVFVSQYFSGRLEPLNYYWIYIFSGLIGFSTTIAEPSLLAVAIKVEEASSKTIGQLGLRFVVAAGVALGLVLGTYRIVVGTPLYLYILVAYIIVIVLSIFAPKNLIPLAYDSGGVTTSTVTVPIVAALGMGLGSIIPGRSPVIDGFGLIAFASVFPIIAVLLYAIFISFLKKKSKS